MSYDPSVNHTTGTVVYDGSDYFQASANVADHVSSSGSAAFADASGATTSTRFLHQNGASSKVWKPTSTLTNLAAHSSNPTGKYSQNNVVKGASNYFKASASWNAVDDHTHHQMVIAHTCRVGTAGWGVGNLKVRGEDSDIAGHGSDSKSGRTEMKRKVS